MGGHKSRRGRREVDIFILLNLAEGDEEYFLAVFSFVLTQVLAVKITEILQKK